MAARPGRGYRGEPNHGPEASLSPDPFLPLLANEPGSLSELERALGCSLVRDRTGKEAWSLSRQDPVEGIHFLLAAFAGYALHDETDPRLDELRLASAGVDLRGAAVGMFGPGTEEPHLDSVKHVWSRLHGRFEMYDDPTWIFWQRHEPPFRQVRSPEEEVWFTRRLAALLAGPIDDERIRFAYGVPMMSGSWPDRFVRDHTWKLIIRPIEMTTPDRLTLTLEPAMPVESLLAGLGLGSALVSTSGVHQQSAILVDASTRRPFAVNGHQVEMHVEGVQNLAPSSVSMPAQRAYEAHGARILSIDVRPGKS